MKYIYLPVLLLFASCEDWYGKPVPLGDEFEDHWYVLDSLQEQVKYLCTSNTLPDCFFAISASRIWQVKDTLVQIAYFDAELTCLAASFSLPEQLLAGTTSPFVIFVDASGDTSGISIPGIPYVSYVSFDPLDAREIYAGDDNLMLRRDSNGVDFDTIFNCANNILDFIVSDSGSLYIASAGNIFLSTDRGTTWDTIYTSAGAPISQITLDQQENLYAGCGNTIYRISDNVNWAAFYEDSVTWELMAGIADGIIIARQHSSMVEARKITSSGQINDISHGIVIPFGSPSILLAANGNKYLLSNSHLERENAVLFYFNDTDLPP